MRELQVLTTSQINDTFLPNRILKEYDELADRFDESIRWNYISEEKLWRELCFCILSGNVSFELAKSVVEVTTEKGYLDYKWIKENKKAATILFHELDKPNFEPLKKNGELRKYRFPKKRAFEITKAAKIIYFENSLKKFLREYDSGIQLRNFLIKLIPGLGIKEASHFLRNVGFAEPLAIIDVHVLAFLKELSLVDFDGRSSLTHKRYLKLEKILRNLADYHGLNLSILDLAIWNYMRNRM